jgi:adenylate kinase
MDILIFGIQGSGKGTQAKFIAEKYGMKIFETGAELRRLAATDTPLGKKIKETIENGHLVSDEIVMNIVEDFMKRMETDSPILFDGLPRTQKQQHLLNDLLSKYQRNFIGLYVNVPEEETLKRLLARGRNDDHEDSIRNRFAAFYKDTMPIIEKYMQDNKMLQINGYQTIENVKKDIDSALLPYLVKS